MRKGLQLCVTILQWAGVFAGLRGTGCVGECGQQGDGERRWEGPDQEQGELLSTSLVKYLAKSCLIEEDFWSSFFEGIWSIMVMQLVTTTTGSRDMNGYIQPASAFSLRMGLSSSVKQIQRCPQRCAQRQVP